MGKGMGAGGLTAQTFPSQREKANQENIVYREPVSIKSKTSSANEERESTATFIKDTSIDLNKKGPQKDDDDDLFGDDDDDKLLAMRAARMKELVAENKKLMEYKKNGHGQYRHINQDEFLPAVTESNLAVCHFYHTEFQRCKTIDAHLQELAKKHITTKFVYIDAEKSPFFVEKMKIKTLPTVVMFRDGIAIDKIVGFEGLGDGEKFETADLEQRLKKVLPMTDGKQADEDEGEKPRINGIRVSSKSFIQDDTSGVRSLLDD
jgi:thiol-disulfide isomerase/thioredoxin